jgi:glycosyltransferase involved in cell wall biosynthesis
MEEFKVSVVIPFYNAKHYVTQAVESALQQGETGEVLLIEDGSPDGGLENCQALAKKYSKVRLLRHPDGANHGAAESRNLGIENAIFPYIAFLDADDYYLPNRFSITVKVFNSAMNVDGVYEAIGAVFEDQPAKDFWLTLPLNEITTVTKEIKPDRLFEELMVGGCGYFSLDGLTVRTSLFLATGLFNEKLTMMEDTDIVYKLSAKGNLYPGSIDIPIAARRVHKGNRITYHLADLRKSHHSEKRLWQSLYQWGIVNLTKEQLFLLSRRYTERLRKVDYLEDMSFMEFVNARLHMIQLIKNAPRLLLDFWFWRMIVPSKQLIKRNIRNLFPL